MKLATAREIRRRVEQFARQHDLVVIPPSKSDRTIMIFEGGPDESLGKQIAEASTWAEISKQLGAYRDAKLYGPRENPMKRRFTAKQIAAQKRFAEMARSGAFKREVKQARKNPSFPNIEKSASPRGIWKYVGYGHDSVYTIGNVGPGNKWAAMRQKGGSGPAYYSASSLREISRWLSKSDVKSNPRISEATAHKLRKAAPQVFRKMTDEEIKAAVRVKNPRGRSTRSVHRVSQTTKHKPSKRLVTRRIRTLRAPKGFFANPRVRKLKFAVHAGTSLHTLRRVAHFERRKDAYEYARAWHRLHPSQFVKVDSV